MKLVSRIIRHAVPGMFGAMLIALPVVAESLSALARIEPGTAVVRKEGGSVILELGLTQAVPYRVFTLDEPARLVLDFREVDWTGTPLEDMAHAGGFAEIRTGFYRSGWSRLVGEMDGPRQIISAVMVTDPSTGGARVSVVLEPVDAEKFAALSGSPEAEIVEKAIAVPGASEGTDSDLVVVLDPGHGGIDPGAESGDVVEADLMLSMARQVKETLLRRGGYQVVLTREADEFVSLDRRVTIARQAEADIFLSLHADALSEGRASGATVYTLSEEASDLASEQLAARHDRANLMAGVDLRGQDDAIAMVLLDLARTETRPRSRKLAMTLVEALRDKDIPLYKTPIQEAGFSVLKAPDVPSVLVELGYLSSQKDRKNLTREDWQRKVASAISDAVESWILQDAADQELVRQ